MHSQDLHPTAPAGANQLVGIGLRHPHYAAFFDTAPPLGFIEVHSENFFADGGATLSVLHQARAHCAVSLHGVGLGLGSAAGVDAWHLERLARLVQRIEPVRVSDHACFARGFLDVDKLIHANDLLPVAFTEAALNIMASNVMQVQNRLGRTILVENLSSYLSFSDNTYAEPDFFRQLCQRTGCGMLLDVNNLMVNALNAVMADETAADPLRACCDFIDALPLGLVGEIHLAGYCETHFEDPETGESAHMLIDDHGSRVRSAVWAVYQHALSRFGAVPTLVEWDTDLPAFDVLLAEAHHAAKLMCA
jgi:uncharacterized protein